MSYFTINEFIKSNTAFKYKIDNTPTDYIKAKIQELIDNVLDPLRSYYGHPIYITSGYRCPELNSAVGGSKTSQHMKGEAADFTTGNIQDNIKLFFYIIENMNFDQIILERNGEWIHVSYKPNELTTHDTNRHSILINLPPITADVTNHTSDSIKMWKERIIEQSSLEQSKRLSKFT